MESVQGSDVQVGAAWGADDPLGMAAAVQRDVEVAGGAKTPEQRRRRSLHPPGVGLGGGEGGEGGECTVPRFCGSGEGKYGARDLCVSV